MACRCIPMYNISSQLAASGRLSEMRLIGCSSQPSLKLVRPCARKQPFRVYVTRQADFVRTTSKSSYHSSTPQAPLLLSLLHPSSLAMASLTQKRGHRGHSHHHHHHHDNAYLISTNK